MPYDKAYTIRIFAGSLPPNTTVPVGAPPSGKLWVIRCVSYYANVGPSVRMLLRRPSDNTTLLALDHSTGGTSQTWNGRLVVPTGETIEIYQYTEWASCQITGYLLGTEAV